MSSIQNLIKEALCCLIEERQECSSEPIVYCRCDGPQATLCAIPDGRGGDAQELVSKRTTWEDQEFVIAMDTEIDEGGTFAEFIEDRNGLVASRGDVIKMNGEEYKVLPRFGGEIGQFTNSYKKAFRVYTKCVGLTREEDG